MNEAKERAAFETWAAWTWPNSAPPAAAWQGWRGRATADEATSLTAAHALPFPGGEFLPPLEPDPVKVITAEWNKVGSPELWAEVDKLRKENAALRVAPAYHLFALLKQGRDLIEPVITMHIYDEEVPADNPYTAHVKAVDKLLGSA